MDSPQAQLPQTPRPTPRWRRDVVFFAIAAAIIALDQFTKYLVRANLGLYEQWPDHPVLNTRIIHAVNSGAAFGILQGQTPLLIGTSILGLGAILVYYLYPPMEHGLVRIALGMQLGGAMGNFIDRVRVGEVTDFINVGSFPTFNVADASITVSIAVVLVFFLAQDLSEHRKQGPPGDAVVTANDD